MDGMVKKELELLLSSKLPQQTLEVLDDIVLDYLTNVLEMLDQDDSFNIEEFLAMMDAYIPGFGDIPSDFVFLWMVGLADKLRKTRVKIKEHVVFNDEYGLSNHLKTSPMPEYTHKPLDVLNKSTSPNRDRKLTKAEARSSSSRTLTSDHSERQTIQYTSQDKVKKNMENFSFNSAFEILCELFPSACSLEVKRCLTVANGDADEAARLLLMTRESSLSDTGQHFFTDSNPKATFDISTSLPDSEAYGNKTIQIPPKRKRPHQASAKRQNLCESEQEEIKSKLLSRYGFVDVRDDQQTHRPFTKNYEEKKQIRYRDNQIVSTKGERYTLEKKRETEQEKQTYINLKPARKYRFH